MSQVNEVSEVDVLCPVSERSMVVPVSYLFLVGAGLSWLLFRMVHKREIEKIQQFETVQNEISTIKESLYKAEAEKMALKIEMEKIICQAVSRATRGTPLSI